MCVDLIFNLAFLSEEMWLLEKNHLFATVEKNNITSKIIVGTLYKNSFNKTTQHMITKPYKIIYIHLKQSIELIKNAIEIPNIPHGVQFT